MIPQKYQNPSNPTQSLVNIVLNAVEVGQKNDPETIALFLDGMENTIEDLLKQSLPFSLVAWATNRAEQTIAKFGKACQIGYCAVRIIHSDLPKLKRRLDTGKITFPEFCRQIWLISHYLENIEVNGVNGLENDETYQSYLHLTNQK